MEFTHSMHVKVRTGRNSSEWMIKKILKATYHVFHDFPARQEHYVDITENDEFPPPFCSAPCLEDKKVTRSLIVCR